MARSPREAEWLTVRDVARWLRVSQRTVWRWAARGILPPAQRLPSHRTRWRLADLRRFLDQMVRPTKK